MDLPRGVRNTSLIIMEAYQLLLVELSGRSISLQTSGSSREKLQGTGGMHVLES